jgi:predicted Ser/Thr protein kinase
VGCPSENTIQELVAGALSGDARARVHSHIETCAACRTLVIELARDADIEAHIAARAYAAAEPASGVLSATGTASANASATQGAAPAVGATLGRYQLERELGAGAMGVVHAAFDPGLERRIALKVLRGTATFEARDRLLREARAMARLTHPNVVTVHEVSFAEGRDFVAMELVHGETLAEWLRGAKRTPAAILDAFLAAGRGLAAAHAAGIVHRDFKPHNVLRSRAGRIVVTDFGLAREAENQLPALETTLVGTASRPPSALAGITITGSLLGTPAYMAPEQWEAGAVTPATDQFAFCVALWEALSGERPYRGPTFDDLKRQVACGPAALDASRIPRRVRGLLRRGLDPDPAKRWPSMDALLARLARARRGPGVALAIAGGALIAAGALVFTLRPGAPPPPACEPPARDVATVWSPAIASDVRAKASDAHAAVLNTAFRDWQTARTAACTASTQVRAAQLHCLDGVLDRFDALRRAFAEVPSSVAEDIQAQLIDPAICRKSTIAEVPRLTLSPRPEVIAAYKLLARSSTDAWPADREIAALTDATAVDPCARVIATLVFGWMSDDGSRIRALMGNAVSAADQCGDERLRAELLIRSVAYQREQPITGPKGRAALALAEVAAERVMQPDIRAALAVQRITAARDGERWDELFRLYEVAIAGYGARGMQVRQLGVVISRNRTRLLRRALSDLDALAADVRTWRPVAFASHQPDLAWQLDFQDAGARFWRADATAHADIFRLWLARPATVREREAGSRTVEGEVVDGDGHPVAGATVAAATHLTADAVGICLPMMTLNNAPQITTTNAAGRFVMHNVTAVGAVAAQLADRRSLPAAIADHVKLVLERTRSVSGKVDLQGSAHSEVLVDYQPVLRTPVDFDLVAPIGPDGSFVLSGVPRGAGQIWVENWSGEREWHAESQPVPASPRSISDVQLTVAKSTRTVDVVVRSAAATRLDGAAVLLIAGKQQPRTGADLSRLKSTAVVRRLAKPSAAEATPGPGADKIRDGDLLAHMEHARRGYLTVCAYSLNDELRDPAAEQRFQVHFEQLLLTCKQIGPNASTVVLSVPPPQRFD